MNTSTSTGRLRRSIALGLATAAIAAAAAQAGHQDGLRPDGYQPQLQVSETSAPIGHRDGPDGRQPPVLPDLIDRYLRNNAPEAAGTTMLIGHRDGPDGYQPGLRDGRPVASAAANRFDWLDAGVGAGFSITLVLLAAAAAAAMRHSRAGLKTS